jgi:hypothetical protein
VTFRGHHDDEPSTALPGRSGTAFVVQPDALAPQGVQAPITKPPAFGGKATQPFAELTVIAARGDLAMFVDLL